MPVRAAPGPRAYVTLNGRETAHRPGTLARGTDGDDEISLSTTELTYNRLPLIALAGGPGNDTFYFGAPVNAWGGRGDDLFYNPGQNFYNPGLYLVPRLFGGAGRDTFYDGSGSADRYGGDGADHYATRRPGTINGAQEGDIDRMWLEGGNDSALVTFQSVSNPELGIVLEQRSIIVDGGAGIDTLRLESMDFIGSLFGDDTGLLDLSRMARETMQINNAILSNFERFDLQISLGVISELRTGQYDDVVEITGSWPGWDADEPLPFLLRLGAGHDRAIGSVTDLSETIIGGAGHDLLISNGTDPEGRDALFGGEGNDILVAAAYTISHLNVRMSGGAGRDTFVIWRGYSADQIITDFVQGEDRLVLNAGSFWNYDHHLPRADLLAGIRPGRELELLHEDARFLEVGVITNEHYGTLYGQQLRYDRDSGVLWARGVSDDPWGRIGRILDAPDLTLADLGFLPEVEWPAG